jgi:transketolase
MLHWTLFEEQLAAYRDSALAGGTVKAATEAAGPIGWKRYLEAADKFIGMHDFRASAQYADLYRHFGITAVAAADAALAAFKGY